MLLYNILIKNHDKTTLLLGGEISNHMKEILGGCMTNFFRRTCLHAKRTYKYDQYEVWEVQDEDFQEMCDMTEEEFIGLAGEDAWWRNSKGSNMGIPTSKFIVNGKKMIGWDNGAYSESKKNYANLSDYLCNRIGASQPKNVCALATDLAKYNHMTMAELFEKYEKR